MISGRYMTDISPTLRGTRPRPSGALSEYEYVCEESLGFRNRRCHATDQKTTAGHADVDRP